MSCWKNKFQRFYTSLGVLLVFVTGLASCHSEKQPATFYPVDSLISRQVQHLTAVHAQLYKEAFLNGAVDTMRYAPADTLGWNKELDVFRQLDVINKPVNKGSYLVDDGLFDPSSNLTVKAFRSLKELPVVYLKIYYQGSMAKPRKMEALYQEANLLSESSRVLSMHFQEIENETVLTSYEVRGGQKMIFGDSVVFYIKGKVLID